VTALDRSDFSFEEYFTSSTKIICIVIYLLQLLLDFC